MSDLKIFKNECDWIIAADQDDAHAVYAAHLGYRTPEECRAELGEFDFEELPPESLITIRGVTEPPSLIRKTAREWVEDTGRGHLCAVVL